MAGWRVTAEAGRFDEALEHFASRTALTDEERKRIPADARSRAFWIAGVAQLDVVQRVQEKLAKAIESGTALEDFKKQVRDDLATTTGGHLETVFRNATQTAYNAGRWRQMSDPSVARFRPFWMYDAILDSRTTPLCNGLSGTVLEASDPWWDTHTPPLHHRCRSGIRSLRRSEAEKRGITTTAPAETPPDGFGLSPKLAKEWRPEPGSRDAGLLAEFTRKNGDLEKRPALPALPREFAKSTPANQQSLPIETAVEHDGRTIELSPEQQAANQTARLMRASHANRASATYEQRRDWLLWDWQRGQARTTALLHYAASREFKANGSIPGSTEHGFAASDATRTQRDLRRLYDATQSWFRARKIRTLRVYRAVPQGEDFDRVVESWTTDKEVAERQARKLGNGQVLTITVPVKQVLAKSGSAGWVDGPLGSQGEVLILW